MLQCTPPNHGESKSQSAKDTGGVVCFWFLPRADRPVLQGSEAKAEVKVDKGKTQSPDLKESKAESQKKDSQLQPKESQLERWVRSDRKRLHEPLDETERSHVRALMGPEDCEDDDDCDFFFASLVFSGKIKAPDSLLRLYPERPAGTTLRSSS